MNVSSKHRDNLYNLVRAVVCYRGPNQYDAEVSVSWLKKQWVVKKGLTTREEAQGLADATADLLHARVEETILTQLVGWGYKEAKE